MKISIITINFNNLEGLKKTVNSVINQTYTNIEYIVIDGASTDGSAEYIKEKKNHFNYWVSEPDKGIYNAMNKGIDYATGDYLLFLNSGDYFYDNDVINKVVNLNPTEDIVYGNVKRFPSTDIYDGEFTFEKLFIKNISHQAIFYNEAVFRRLGKYNEAYKIRADYSLNIKIFEVGTYRYLNLIISNVDSEGISSHSFDYDFWNDYKKNYLIPFSGIIKKRKIYTLLWEYYYRVLLDQKNISKSIKLYIIISSKELNFYNSYKALRPLISIILT